MLCGVVAACCVAVVKRNPLSLQINLKQATG